MRVVKHWNRLLRGGRCPIPRNIQGEAGWANWSSGRCPCSLQGGWTRWSLKVPSNPNHSMISCCYREVCSSPCRAVHSHVCLCDLQSGCHFRDFLCFSPAPSLSPPPTNSLSEVMHNSDWGWDLEKRLLLSPKAVERNISKLGWVVFFFSPRLLLSSTLFH